MVLVELDGEIDAVVLVLEGDGVGGIVVATSAVAGSGCAFTVVAFDKELATFLRFLGDMIEFYQSIIFDVVCGLVLVDKSLISTVYINFADAFMK
jgi:hypothetical protein